MSITLGDATWSVVTGEATASSKKLLVKKGIRSTVSIKYEISSQIIPSIARAARPLERERERERLAFLPLQASYHQNHCSFCSSLQTVAECEYQSPFYWHVRTKSISLH